MDSPERTLACVALVVLVACALLGTPVGSAAGSDSQADRAVPPVAVLGQTEAGNTPTATPAGTPTATGTGTATATPTDTGTPAPTADSTPEPTTATQTSTSPPSRTQRAVGPPTVRVVNDSLEPGQVVVVTATFTNSGITAQEVNAVFRAYGETVEQEEFLIPAGESATVQFDQRLDEPGRYWFSVNGQTATVDVVRSTPTPIGSGDSAPRSVTELVTVTVVLLGAGVVLLIRRL